MCLEKAFAIVTISDSSKAEDDPGATARWLLLSTAIIECRFS
jgi:hypothetical protein